MKNEEKVMKQSNAGVATMIIILELIIIALYVFFFINA